MAYKGFGLKGSVLEPVSSLTSLMKSTMGRIYVYPLDIYPGYISKCWIYDIDIYPFGILDMLIYPQMDLDLGYFCFIKYPFWPLDIGYGYISI